jgi:Asp-tRNA(Asn)/Glu-tRNA(Gln) amidotransferase A subunit family amidase
MLTRCAIFLLTLLASQPWENEIAKYDKEIDYLQDLQGMYRANAERNVNNAMRWQFQNENYLDARQAWDKAAQDKQKIREIQDQIDDLKNKKSELLKKHDKATF